MHVLYHAHRALYWNSAAHPLESADHSNKEDLKLWVISVNLESERMALFCGLLSFHARPARQRGGSKRQTPAKPVLPKVSLRSSGSGSVACFVLWCACVCVRVYVYCVFIVCVCVCVCCVFIGCICACLLCFHSVCVCVCVCVCVLLCVCVMCIVWCVCMCMCAYMSVCAFACICVRVCICMQLKICQFILLHECDQHFDPVSVPIDQQMNSPWLSTNLFLFFFFLIYFIRTKTPQRGSLRKSGSGNSDRSADIYDTDDLLNYFWEIWHSAYVPSTFVLVFCVLCMSSVTHLHTTRFGQLESERDTINTKLTMATFVWSVL